MGQQPRANLEVRSSDRYAHHRQVELEGAVWNVFRFAVHNDVTFFVAVGADAAEVYGAVDRQKAEALATLQEEVDAGALRIGNASQDANAQVLRAQALVAAEFAAVYGRILNESHVLHANSHAAAQSAGARAQSALDGITDENARRVRDVEREGRAGLRTNAVWTNGLAGAVLLAVVLIGTYATYVITRALHAILRRVEALADMRVETLQGDRSGDWVSEIRRIQSAFAMVARHLQQYKSYLPAALFQRHR